MSILRDFIELITTQPGALVYHLVVLFAIQLIAGVAISHWQRQRDAPATRLLVMGAGLFLARAVLMLMAVLDSVGLISSPVLFPPLERFLHFLTAMLVVWAFLPVVDRSERLSTTLLLLTALVAAGAYAAFATLWPPAEAEGIAYNSYWQESAWQLSTSGLLALALVASLAWRGQDWAWLVFLLGLWLAGHVLQLVAPDTEAHTAGWVRLADLAGLPLLAGLTYRRALGAAVFPVEGSKEQSADNTGLLEAVQRIRRDKALDSGLRLAAPSIARAVDADMVAIGLLVHGPVEVLRVAALHPSTSVMAAQQEPTLLLPKHPLLSKACHGRRLERASGDRHESHRMNALYRRLGFEGSGPLLVQPLITSDDVLGLILMGNPKSQRAWTSDEEQLLHAVAYLLTSAIAGDGYQDPGSGEQLVEARKEAQEMANRVTELQDRLERQRQRSDKLATKLRLREQEAAEHERASAALAVWQEEVRELAEARDTLQVELSQWRKRAKKLGQAKAKLEHQLSRVSVTASKTSDGRFGGGLVGDEKGEVVLASRNVHRLFGKARADLIASPMRELFEAPWWKETVDRLLNEEPGPPDTTSVTLELGERIVLAELSRLPMGEDGLGAVVALFHVVEGPTVERAMVASLIQELRTPMTSVTGYTDLLLGERVGILGESQRRLLLRVEANIERMERLLNDLIRATDVDAGQVSLSPEPAQVDEVIRNALDALSARLDEKDLKVELDLPTDLPPAHADRDSLQQIVLNLLSNAALSSQPGTRIQVGVDIEERPDDLEGLPGYLLVSFADTGGGIAPEDRTRVFHRFYRADTPLIPGLGDTGVGLSVAKALVEANNGRIWVESEMGSGSTFSVMLPVSSSNGAGETEL